VALLGLALSFSEKLKHALNHIRYVLKQNLNKNYSILPVNLILMYYYMGTLSCEIEILTDLLPHTYL